jgi:hypothetical protein
MARDDLIDALRQHSESDDKKLGGAVQRVESLLETAPGDARLFARNLAVSIFHNRGQ